jgi:hypothetical protein
MNNIEIFKSIPKNLEQLSLGKISQNNYFDGDITPKFINADLKNFKDLKKNYNQEVTTKGINNIKENTNASLDESEYTKHSLCPSIFTLKKVDFEPLNRNNKASSNTKNNEKILNDDTKKEFNNIKTKTQTHFSKSHSKRNSHYSSSSKRPKKFANFILENKSNCETNKNYKKINSNNSQKRQKDSCFKKLNKYHASKDVFVELFVLANELYKNEEINDQEKIIFKQLIINKSERLLHIFVDNKDCRNNLVNSIKEVLHLMIKNSLN